MFPSTEAGLHWLLRMTAWPLEGHGAVRVEPHPSLQTHGCPVPMKANAICTLLIAFASLVVSQSPASLSAGTLLNGILRPFKR